MLVGLGCESRFPAAVVAPQGERTDGWVFIRVRTVPTQLIYTPMVGDQASTVGNVKPVTVSPASVRITVSAHTTETTSGSPPSTTVAPQATTAGVTPTELDPEGR